MPNYRRIKIEGGVYFFTLVTNYRQGLFLLAKTSDLFLESLNHVRNLHPFSNIAYCILPDHIHMLWEMPINDADYSMRISEIKKRFSKQFIAKFGNPKLANSTQLKRGESGIWQRRFWDHFIRDEQDFNNHLDYIHYNPVKHGLVAQVNDWEASSFFDYVKQGFYDIDWGQDGSHKIESNLFGE